MQTDKLQLVNTFEGGIDTDTADRLIAQNKIRYGLNIEYTATAEGKVGIVRNVKGNLLIETPLPEGTNKTIGAVTDEEKYYFYWLNYNSNGYHTIYQYDVRQKKVNIVLQSKTHSDGVDILKFSAERLILDIDIIDNNFLNFVDSPNPAREINISKCLSRTYNNTMTEEFINLFKLPPAFAPSLQYSTDDTRLTNFVYGKMYKASARFVYDNGQKSNWSDWSSVPTAKGESYKLIESISNNNNLLLVTVPTGSMNVVKIEISVKINSLDFKLVATLDKEKLNIGNDSTYTYKFYNDSTLLATDASKLIRPQSFIPKAPKVQAYVHNALVLGAGKEGFETVDIDVDVSVDYRDLKIEKDGELIMNKPYFQASIDGTTHDVVTPPQSNPHHYILSWVSLAVGNDVKEGNIFTLSLKANKNGDTPNPDNFFWRYEATRTDSQLTIANKFKEFIRSTGRVKTGGYMGTPIQYNIDAALEHRGDGAVVFRFIYQSQNFGEAIQATANATGSLYEEITDLGVPIKKIKAGGAVKYGIQYEDKEGLRKSPVYTLDSLLVQTKFITETAGIKLPVHILTINHTPPEWAAYYQIVRTDDLIYGNYLYVYVQQVVEVPLTSNEIYYDLIVGSIYTYKRMFPNSVLTYNFDKGDRIRFVSDKDGTLYDSTETIAIDYKDRQEDTYNFTITCNKTNKVVPENGAKEDNVGRFISINGVEREITSLDNGAYTLSASIPFEETYASYQIIDYRGIIRVRKSDNIPLDSVEEGCLIEVSKRANYNSDNNLLPYYEFDKKFAINTIEGSRYHGGNIQDQQDGQPAIVEVGEGTCYAKYREYPTNNVVPGAQTTAIQIEDANISDFYESDLNDNGRSNAQDDGKGEVYFGERLRYSNNRISDTEINGLNDFDNDNREDYNDPNGDFMRLIYREKRLYAFKVLKTGYIPVNESVLIDNSGEQLVSTSSKLLNSMQYFDWEGGVGSNPESIAQDGNWIYFASRNSGIVARVGGDGVNPVSEYYHMDNEVRRYLANSGMNGGRIIGGFDRTKAVYILYLEKCAYDSSTGTYENRTVAYRDKLREWVTHYSYEPEYMLKFENDFFVFKNGQLWQNNVNETRNNFFGEQYPSVVSFISNKDHNKKKLFFNLVLDGTGKWKVPAIKVNATDQFPKGMLSRLGSGNLKLIDGNYYADLLRDMKDPAFNHIADEQTRQLTALFEGRMLQGNYLDIELRNEETREVELVSATVLYDEI